MKIKIIKRNLLMAGIFLALMGQGAMAGEGKRIFHEEKWKDTMAYGRIIISEDSAREWGPWTEFVQPAAGAMTLAALPQVTTDGPSYFRPESADEYSPKYTSGGPQVAGPPPVTEGSEWHGYAAYETYEYRGDGEGSYYYYSGNEPARIALRLMPDNPEEVTVDGGSGDGKVSYRLDNLAGTTVVRQSGDLDAEFYDGLSEFDAEEGYYYGEGWEGIDGYPTWPIVTREVTAGWWSDPEGRQGNFVAGIPTPLSNMDKLRIDNIQANYYGTSFDSWRDVDITVNFGSGTWNGSWNNGADGSTWTYTDDRGIMYVRGDVGFNAGGTINGANIQSTSVSATDGAVSGQVQGNFFGSNAEALGGAVDITKSTEGYTNARHVDVFITCKDVRCEPYD